MWCGIRDLQHGRKGLIPSREVTITDKNGNPVVTLPLSRHAGGDIIHQCMLNLCSSFSAHELDLLK